MKFGQAAGVFLTVILGLIFIPSWLIASILGIFLLLGLTGQLGKLLALSEKTTKILTTLGLVSFLISIGWGLGEWKYPWLFKALNARHIFWSYEGADLVDPRYPLKLSMAVIRAEQARLDQEERKHVQILEEYTKRRQSGLPETKEERDLVEEAKKQVQIIRRELEKLRLVSEDVSRPGIFTAFALSSKLIIFGIVLLAPGMIFSKGFLKTLGIFFLIGGIAWHLFGKDLTATTKPAPPSVQQMRSPPGQRPVARAQPAPQQETAPAAKEFTFIVPPDRPSEPLSVPSKDFCIHIDGPETVRVIDRDGRTLFHIGEPMTSRILAEFERGVRFVGPPSEVKVTLTIKKTELTDTRPKQEQELLFLGKDFNRLAFPENAYLSKASHWKIQVSSAEILPDRNLKLNFIHTSKGSYKEVLIWIENPESTTYITDNFGRRYNFVREENLGTNRSREKVWLGGKIFPRDVPLGYSMMFSAPPDNVTAINFVSRYFPCVSIFPRSDGTHGCVGAFPEAVTIGGIKLFREKG